MSGRVERVVARLLPVVVAAWALASLGSGRVGIPEPYPSPLLPGFRGAPEIGETFEWSSIEVEVLDASGEIHRLRGHELLADVPLIHTAVFDSAFFESRNLQPDRVAPRSTWSRFAFGVPEGRTPEGLARHHHPESVEWLRSRVAILLSSVEPVEATIYRQHWETRVSDGEHLPSDRGIEVTIPLMEDS